MKWVSKTHFEFNQPGKIPLKQISFNMVIMCLGFHLKDLSCKAQSLKNIDLQNIRCINNNYYVILGISN